MSWWHRHPVLTNAAGGVIAAGVVAVLAQTKGWIDLAAWWQAVTNVAVNAWHWVPASTSAPNWLLVIMGVATLGWLAVLIMLAISNREEAEQAYSVLAYDNDVFFNMRWRWQWRDGGRLHNIVPFCLKCDMQIDPCLRGGGYRFVAPLIFPCRLCGEVQYEVGAGDTNLDDVQREVTLLIQRNIRQQIAKQQQEQSSNE